MHHGTLGVALIPWIHTSLDISDAMPMAGSDFSEQKVFQPNIDQGD